MKKLLVNLCALMALSLMVSNVHAQLSTPAPSPGSKLMQTVGLTEVTVEYSRPGVKGRTVFGGAEALEQYGEPWRTGANSATKVSFSKDVKIADQDLKAGSYALFTVPGAKNWEVMFFNYDTPNAGGYGDKEPVLKAKILAGKTGREIESFTIDINNLTNNGATIDLMWQNTLVSIPMAVHTSKEVMASFDKMTTGPSNAEYYAMGNYLFEEGKDLDKALSYIQKATKVDKPRFWQVHREALVLGKLGKQKEAIEVAKKSMALAKEANNSDYVALNKKLISSLMTK